MGTQVVLWVLLCSVQFIVLAVVCTYLTETEYYLNVENYLGHQNLSMHFLFQ